MDKDIWPCGRPIGRYPGIYPLGFLKRVKKKYGFNGQMLHICSGSLNGSHTGIKIDLEYKNPNVAPDVVCDAQKLPFKDGVFDRVWADPPYNQEYAGRYGHPLPGIMKILKEGVRVAKEGGIVGMLHFTVPWTPLGSKRIGHFAVYQGPGFQGRTFAVFEKMNTLKQWIDPEHNSLDLR